MEVRGFILIVYCGLFLLTLSCPLLSITWGKNAVNCNLMALEVLRSFKSSFFIYWSSIICVLFMWILVHKKLIFEMVVFKHYQILIWGKVNKTCNCPISWKCHHKFLALSTLTDNLLLQFWEMDIFLKWNTNEASFISQIT